MLYLYREGGPQCSHECMCQCHGTDGLGTGRHIRACCDPCAICVRRIKIGLERLHLDACHHDAEADEKSLLEETSAKGFLFEKQARRLHGVLKDRFSLAAQKEFSHLWTWGIERISDKRIRRSVKVYYCDKVPLEFFIAGASTRRKGEKGHPYWHNKPGGIMRHLTEGCVVANRLLDSYGFVTASGRIDPQARDIVLAATVLSDTQKNGIPWGEKSVKNHGEIAANTWRPVAELCGVSRELADQIAEAVHWHYGRWTPSEAPKRLQDLPDLVKIVHLLDACSANCENEMIFEPRAVIEFLNDDTPYLERHIAP